jgi:hypothetical protein
MMSLLDRDSDPSRSDISFSIGLSSIGTHVRDILQSVIGEVLIALGIRLAFEQRESGPIRKGMIT